MPIDPSNLLRTGLLKGVFFIIVIIRKCLASPNEFESLIMKRMIYKSDDRAFDVN